MKLVEQSKKLRRRVNVLGYLQRIEVAAANGRIINCDRHYMIAFMISSIESKRVNIPLNLNLTTAYGRS